MSGATPAESGASPGVIGQIVTLVRHNTAGGVVVEENVQFEMTIPNLGSGYTVYRFADDSSEGINIEAEGGSIGQCSTSYKVRVSINGAEDRHLLVHLDDRRLYAEHQQVVHVVSMSLFSFYLVCTSTHVTQFGCG